MNAWLTRPCAVFACVAAFLLVDCAAVAGPDDPSVLPAAPGYKALLVGISHYQFNATLPDLPNAVPSIQRLAKALRRARYQVEEIHDADATAERVERWFADLKPAETSLAIVVLAGHGEESQGKQRFLTYEATASRQQGVLAIDDLLTRGGKFYAGAPRLKGDRAAYRTRQLVLIIDACRTNFREASGRGAGSDPDRGPGPDALSLMLTRGSTPQGAKDRPKVKPPQPILVQSTRYGKPAADAKDLVSALADGLEIENSRFRADPWSMVPGWKGDPEGGNDPEGHPLSLFFWFRYGIGNHSDAHKLQQQAQLDGGAEQLDTLLAQANPPGPPSQPVNPLSGGQGRRINLLKFWQPQFGDYNYERSRGDDSCEVSVPLGEIRQPWLGGFVAEQAEGYDTTGKAVFVELLPSSTFVDPYPDKSMRIGLHAKYVRGARDEDMLEDARRVIPIDRPSWCKISLPPRRQLNFLAITDLPADATVQIRQILLADTTFTIPGFAGPIDLMARWWTDELGRTDPNTLVHSLVPIAGGRRGVRIEKGRGWMGGMLGPPIWVSQGQELELTLVNEENVPLDVMFEIKRGYDALGRRTVHLESQRSTVRLPVTENGQANFFAVTNPTASLIIEAIELKPMALK